MVEVFGSPLAGDEAIGVLPLSDDPEGASDDRWGVDDGMLRGAAEGIVAEGKERSAANCQSMLAFLPLPGCLLSHLKLDTNAYET
jgi:hypothetical protein